MIRAISKLLMVIAASFLFASCAVQKPAYDLDGTRWQLASMDGVADPPSSQLTFTNKTISGSGICNVYDGDYRLVGDRLVVTNVVKSPYFCGEPIDSMERQFFEALESGPAMSIEGDKLTIAAPSGMRLTFTTFKVGN